jgi:hypothetical protein
MIELTIYNHRANVYFEKIHFNRNYEATKNPSGNAFYVLKILHPST